MTAAQLSPNAVQALEEARVLLRETTGFMYLPVFAPSERAAGLAMDALRPALSGEPFRVAWPPTRPAPSDTTLAAVDLASDRAQLLQNLDTAIASLPENSVLVLNATGTTRTPLALHMPAYLNLRREPLRTAKLRFLLFWPAAHRETLMAGAPDLWSMRAASPWADEIEYVESEPGNTTGRLSATTDPAGPAALSPSMARSWQRWRMHRNVKDTNMSVADALALVEALDADRQFSDALEIAEFIPRHLDDLSEPDRDAGMPYRAAAQYWISLLRYTLGNRQAALAPAQDAVAIRRRLANANPAAYEPDLAMSLNNLANRLSAMGERVAALGPAQEAVAIYRRLANANPAAYEPDLANSLNTLAIRLNVKGDVGAPEATRAAALESLAIRRRLAGANPAGYEADLARSLGTGMQCLASAGDTETARAMGNEALAVFTRLAQAHPNVFDQLRDDTARQLAALRGLNGTGHDASRQPRVGPA